MSLNHYDPVPISEPDSFTAYTVKTPPETEAGGLPDLGEKSDNGIFISSSVPWPGSTFIIRSISTGKVITLLDGKIVLSKPGGRGSIHWECVETKGWLGFRNPVSGKFLGHDKHQKLCCWASLHQGWENFCVRMRPEGGYVLLMQHWERLWHVGSREEQGMEILAKMGDGGNDGILWQFVKVP